MIWRRPILIAVLAFAAGAAGFIRAQAAEIVVTRIDVPDMKAVFAKVESARIVPARTRIGGSVRSIAIVEGDRVTEGQVIALVVDDKLDIERSAADARIEALKAQLGNAQAELDRQQRLLAQGATTRARFDQAKTQFDVMVGQVAAAEAERAVIEQRAREGEVRAAAEGRVLTVPVTLGSVVLGGEEIARVASGRYYLRLSLPERHAAEIRQDAVVQIGQRGLSPGTNDDIAKAQPGRVARVYPEIVGGRVIADVEVDGIGDYFVGERTLVWIPVARRSVLAVPADAVTTRHGIDYVRVAAGDGTLEVAVILGQTVQTPQGPRLEVLTGLREGDRVIVPDPSRSGP